MNMSFASLVFLFVVSICLVFIQTQHILEGREKIFECLSDRTNDKFRNRAVENMMEKLISKVQTIERHHNDEMMRANERLLRVESDNRRLRSQIQRVSDDQKRMQKTKCVVGEIRFSSIPPPQFPYDRNVTFAQPFAETPAVTYGLTLLDISSDKNTRVDVMIRNRTRFGFTLRIHSWADSITYAAAAKWMACG